MITEKKEKLVCAECGSDEINFTGKKVYTTDNEEESNWLCQNCKEATDFITESEYKQNKKQFKLRCAYLNKLVKDGNEFMQMVQEINKLDYFMEFDSKNMNNREFEEYIDTIENMYRKNDIRFK